MTQIVTLELSDELLQRYESGAAAARKSLSEFLVDRLSSPPIPVANDLPWPLNRQLGALENMSDDELWQIARQRLAESQQIRYEELLTANGDDALSETERQELRQLGQAAQQLTLRRAHAYMLLSWRGHDVPLPEEFDDLA